jgi:hypothetical protein
MSELSSVFALLLLMVFSGAAYVFFAYVLYRIGRKFGIGSFGEYCIPIYNNVLLCRCAGINPWLLLWLLVPLANLGFTVYLWGTLAARLGRDFWLYGIGILLFGIPALILAFDDSRPVKGKEWADGAALSLNPQATALSPGIPVGTPLSLDPRATAPAPSILCTAGEFSGSRVPIGLGGLVIGRSAEKANVVLSSHEISAAHVKVWSDAEGRVWIEDMSSSNGTYYCRPQPGQAPEWIQIKRPVALASGTRFRLGDDVAEFMVS